MCTRVCVCVRACVCVCVCVCVCGVHMWLYRSSDCKFINSYVIARPFEKLYSFRSTLIVDLSMYA